MKSSIIDRLILGTILLALIGDILALFAQLINQREKQKEAQIKADKERRIEQEFETLRKRIAQLERQAGLI